MCCNDNLTSPGMCNNSLAGPRVSPFSSGVHGLSFLFHLGTLRNRHVRITLLNGASIDAFLLDIARDFLRAYSPSANTVLNIPVFNIGALEECLHTCNPCGNSMMG